jgi:predicted negative regulator of RcsB-dependent stress response
MMAKAKPDHTPGDPWYVYLGNWLSFNSRSENFGRLVVLLLIACGIAAGYRWGGPWVDAKIAESKAAATAWVAIAEGARRDHADQNEALGLLLKNELAPPST